MPYQSLLSLMINTIDMFSLQCQNISVLISVLPILALPFRRRPARHAPHYYFRKTSDLFDRQLIPIIAQHHPDILVIGYPAHGPLVRYSHLISWCPGKIVFYDEDLSSKKL